MAMVITMILVNMYLMKGNNYGIIYSILGEVTESITCSPFLKFFDSFKDLPALGYLNWFFPVKDCLVVMAAYLVAVGVYYVYSVIMRWIRAIE